MQHNAVMANMRPLYAKYEVYQILDLFPAMTWMGNRDRPVVTP